MVLRSGFQPRRGGRTLQNGAAAFLRRDGKYLLLKRAPNRRIAPNVWSCVGGHIEAEEMNDPLSACLREISEETLVEWYNLIEYYLEILKYKLKNNYMIIF